MKLCLLMITFLLCLCLFDCFMTNGLKSRIHSIHRQIRQVHDDEAFDLADRAITEEKVMKFTKCNEFLQIENLTLSSLLLEIQSKGVARINNVLSDELVSELLDYVNNELEQSIEDVSNNKYKKSDKFSNSKSSKNRWDLKLSFTDLVKRALTKSLDGLLGDVLFELIGNGEFFELASFVTSNGAGRQIIHSDTLFSQLPHLFTCTIALQDISEDMGPTVFIPNTHTEEVYIQRVYEEENYVIKSYPYVLSTLKAGDVAIYDSRLLHCGGANRSSINRALFYFTLKNPLRNKLFTPIGEVDSDERDEEILQTASLKNENRGLFNLQDFR